METGVNPHPVDSIYIHIPFCDHFCSYCHFVKVPLGRFDLNDYVEALTQEVECRLPLSSDPLRTVYIGGGTPSLLKEHQLQKIVHSLIRRRPLPPDAEFTLEANPGHVNQENLSVWRSQGVNRLSLGVQSFCDEELVRLGRNHSAGQAKSAVEQASVAGFRRLSVDILAALKGQSWTVLRRSLGIAASLPIDHLSLYLMEKPGKPEPCDAAVSRLYFLACRFLCQAGMKPYEISSFARPGGQSRHNRLYWRNGPYHGFGAAASSFDGLCESRNEASIAGYQRKVQSAGSAVVRREYPDPVIRRLVVGLRMSAGLPASALEKSRASAERLLREGVLETRLNRVRIPRRHILLTNSILTELI